MPRLTLVMERTPIQEYELDRPVVQIGRVEGMEIVIDNVSVSRRQAEIRQEGRGWAVRDLGSSNGTFLNGERLTDDPRPLKPGDEISFGKFSLYFEREFTEPLAAAKITPARGRTHAPGTYQLSAEEIERLQQAIATRRQAQLAWEVAGMRGVHQIKGDRALVGRSEACDLRFSVVGPADGILFIRGDRGFEVQNLASWFRFTRMKVNGKVTRRALLTSGDKIEIGEVRLTFLDEIR
ncbi:MAG: FHA domain-containing protein [Candidatus Rokubacteria bacterium]|nr:FHA domain-containing protein [Candidatus Rokubacteria bacterium]